jgi:hypothetical protein
MPTGRSKKSQTIKAFILACVGMAEWRSLGSGWRSLPDRSSVMENISDVKEKSHGYR